MPDDDTGAFVDAMAKVVGLPIDPQSRDKVIANFAISRTIAGLALAEPIADATENGPVFQP
ncbi:MAG: DUF4089 domain-containing protein [Reyranellaceae bacterium]